MLRFLVGRLLGPRRIGVVGTFRPISSSFTYGPVHSHSGRPSALCRSPWSHSPLPRSENKAQSSSKNVRSASLVPSRFLSTQANDEGPTDRLNEKGNFGWKESLLEHANTAPQALTILTWMRLHCRFNSVIFELWVLHFFGLFSLS